jgi:hypothetical protein
MTDLSNITLTSRQDPDDRNAYSLVGIHLECRECGRKWIGMFGAWRIEPGGKVYCDLCANAEAQE